jgi:aminoglycoside phosphotransferase family enzyme
MTMRFDENKDAQTQAEIYKAMATPDFYPHAVDGIEKRDTVISKVFIAGDFAYKIKKPVDYRLSEVV